MAATTSTVTVTLLDVNSNPVSGKTVTLAKSSGPGSPTISAASGSSNAFGVVTFTVKSTTAGADVFTATDTTDTLTVTQTASVTFTAGAVSVSTSTVVASPISVTADGSTTSTVTVTLLDVNSNPVSGKTVTLAKSSGPGSPTISAASGSSNAFGVVTFTVKSTTAGTDVFTATDTTDTLTVTQTASVTFTAGSATQIRVETAADGSGTVVPSQSLSSSDTLTVYAISRDASGNFVANVSAAWSMGSTTDGVANSDLSPTAGPARPSPAIWSAPAGSMPTMAASRPTPG